MAPKNKMFDIILIETNKFFYIITTLYRDFIGCKNIYVIITSLMQCKITVCNSLQEQISGKIFEM